MPLPIDLLNGMMQLSAIINPAWCHSGPDPGNGYLPRLVNTSFGGVIVNNAFANWVLHGAAVPPGGHMNCWEAIMYAACLGGITGRHRLEVLHRAAAMRARNAPGLAAAKAAVYYDALMEFFDYGNFVLRGGHNNLAGDLVFIEDHPPPFERYKHVMLGTGGHMTAWSNDISALQAAGGMGFGHNPHNLVQVNHFRHVHIGYIARYVAFPF